MVDQADTLAETTSDEESEGKFWAAQIEAASKAERDWRKDADRIQERYRNEKRRQKSTLPIFWANVQILKSAVYSATPRPDVRRRDIHEDALQRILGKHAARMIQNALRYEIDNAAFTAAMEAARDDMLIVGRGVVREIYAFDEVRKPVEVMPGMLDPLTGMQGPPAYSVEGEPLDHPDGFEDEELQLGPFVNAIENQRTKTKFSFWSDFRMGDCRTWDDCPWVAFRSAMDEDELAKAFPEHDPKVIPKVITAYRPQGEGSSRGADNSMPVDPESPFGRAEVWEIWSKTSKERIWIATAYEDHVLKKEPAPHNLEGFFPCPRPLYAVPTTDKMVPMPELQIYESLADELDEVQDRLRKLTKLAKAVAVTDGDFTEIVKIADAKDGDLIPTNRQAVVAADLNNAIWRWPIDLVVQAIALLTQRSQALRDDIYELTGISDLRRGIGQERESATAQKLKASYGSVRMTPRSKPMAEFVRDLLRIKAEIIAEHFKPERLVAIGGLAKERDGLQPAIDPMTGMPLINPMTGQPVFAFLGQPVVPQQDEEGPFIDLTPQVLALLKDEKLRATAIDIETDSTVAADAEQDKAEAVEFTTGAVQYLQAVIQVGAMAPEMVPFLMDLLKASSKAFKFGRQVESSMDAMTAQMGATVAQQQMLQQQQAMGASPPPGQAGNGAAQPTMQ